MHYVHIFPFIENRSFSHTLYPNCTPLVNEWHFQCCSWVTFNRVVGQRGHIEIPQQLTAAKTIDCSSQTDINAPLLKSQFFFNTQVYQENFCYIFIGGSINIQMEEILNLKSFGFKWMYYEVDEINEIMSTMPMCWFRDEEHIKTLD